MADQFLSSMTDPTASISFDPSALLTTSTINALHFPGMVASGTSDSGAGSGNRPTSFLFLDGVGMCESMSESFCSTTMGGSGADDTTLINSSHGFSMEPSSSNVGLRPLEKKDSSTKTVNAQKKRRSRKAQYDASMDGPSLDRIESVTIVDEQDEPDDAWLFRVSGTRQNNNHNNSDPTSNNIFSWVHKEFQANEINANKHRLLCKLDDMSHARTIRSVSCHNFAATSGSESVKRSSTEQQVNPEPIMNGRMSSPLRAMSTTPVHNVNGNTRPTSPVSSSPLRYSTVTSNNYPNNNSTVRSRDVSRERERLDYTDLEVLAKVQLENLRQAERQGPLSKRFDRGGTKPPVAPKSAVARNGTKPNNYRRSNTQTISTTSATNGFDIPMVTESGKPPPTSTTNRVSLLPSNSATNNRTRPPTSRPLQAYRGSQTNYNNNNMNAKVPPPPAPSSVQRNGGRKPGTNDLGSTFTAKEFAQITSENGLLNDVSNKPLTAPVRSQVVPQRRAVLPQSSTHSSVEQIPPGSSIDITSNESTSIPRSASSLSQGRKSGIPTIGKPQRPSIPTLTRPASSNTIPSSQSSDSMMMTRTIPAQKTTTTTRPQIPDNMSPTTSWNEGCY